ncbi:hypothetical protein L195_g046251, partial [Trifolium pratense]
GIGVSAGTNPPFGVDDLLNGPAINLSDLHVRSVTLFFFQEDATG